MEKKSKTAGKGIITIKQKVFMGGTIGLSPKPIRGQYYNLVTSLDLHPPSCSSSSASSTANNSCCPPVIKCSPYYCYPPPSCPSQPRRRGC